MQTGQDSWLTKASVPDIDKGQRTDILAAVGGGHAARGRRPNGVGKDRR
jgi:putative intracellular protease/amidase